MAPHTSSATPEQIDALLNFLDEHRDLARGRLRSIEAKVQAKRLWEEMCTILNSMGGCTKTLQQWQKVWFDRKHLAKKAFADSRRSASATGGGPSTAPHLSQWELKVLSIMGDGFGGRQTGARVPAFNDPPVTEPVPSSSRDEPSSQETDEVLYVIEQLSEPTQQPELQQESSLSTPSQQTRPTRRRASRAASGPNISNRLIRFEEERGERETVRNSELAGIRAALLELCGLVRDLINK